MTTTIGVLLLCLLSFVALAIYYTLFGVRRELIATKNELSEIRKLLAGKADKG